MKNPYLEAMRDIKVTNRCNVCLMCIPNGETRYQECTEQGLTPEIYEAWADECDDLRASALETELSSEDYDDIEREKRLLRLLPDGIYTASEMREYLE